jgi:ribosomal protein S19E (S16A)
VERRDLIEEFLNEEITMGEWHKFIKTCPPPEMPPTT